MTEFTMDRLRENLEALKMKNTLEILDNHLEQAVAENLNIVDVLDHIFAEEAKSKRKRAYEKQIQMSGFPIKKTLDDLDFSFQPSIDKRQTDELATMRFLELDIQGANLFFQLIARRYEKTSTVFTSNKTFSQWNEVFADVTIASAILNRVLHHCTVINIKGESYRLKERKEFMRQKQQIVNTLLCKAAPDFCYPNPPAEKLQYFFGVFLQFQIGVDSLFEYVNGRPYRFTRWRSRAVSLEGPPSRLYPFNRPAGGVGQPPSH